MKLWTRGLKDCRKRQRKIVIQGKRKTHRKWIKYNVLKKFKPILRCLLQNEPFIILNLLPSGVLVQCNLSIWPLWTAALLPGRVSVEMFSFSINFLSLPENVNMSHVRTLPCENFLWCCSNVPHVQKECITKRWFVSSTFLRDVKCTFVSFRPTFALKSYNVKWLFTGPVFCDNRLAEEAKALTFNLCLRMCGNINQTI